MKKGSFQQFTVPLTSLAVFYCQVGANPSLIYPHPDPLPERERGIVVGQRIAAGLKDAAPTLTKELAVAGLTTIAQKQGVNQEWLTVGSAAIRGLMNGVAGIGDGLKQGLSALGIAEGAQRLEPKLGAVGAAGVMLVGSAIVAEGLGGGGTRAPPGTEANQNRVAASINKTVTDILSLGGLQKDPKTGEIISTRGNPVGEAIYQSRLSDLVQKAKTVGVGQTVEQYVAQTLLAGATGNAKEVADILEGRARKVLIDGIKSATEYFTDETKKEGVVVADDGSEVRVRNDGGAVSSAEVTEAVEEALGTKGLLKEVRQAMQEAGTTNGIKEKKLANGTKIVTEVKNGKIEKVSVQTAGVGQSYTEVLTLKGVDGNKSLQVNESGEIQQGVVENTLGGVSVRIESGQVGMIMMPLHPGLVPQFIGPPRLLAGHLTKELVRYVIGPGISNEKMPQYLIGLKNALKAQGVPQGQVVILGTMGDTNKIFDLHNIALELIGFDFLTDAAIQEIRSTLPQVPGQKTVFTLYSGYGNFGLKAVEKGDLPIDTLIFVGAPTVEGTAIPGMINKPGHMDNSHVKMVVNVFGENDMFSGGVKRFDNVPTYNFEIKNVPHLGYFPDQDFSNEKVSQWMGQLHANAINETALKEQIINKGLNEGIITFDEEKQVWVVDLSKIK